MMIDLKTNYAGIALKNPIIIGACNLVTEFDNLIKLERAGAAAIVYKSLFEEDSAGSADHLARLKNAKEALSIPLIGSLNCVSKNLWADYAIKMAHTGIDGIELNFYASELNGNIEPSLIEENQVEILRAVKRSLKIPVIVKLSPFYTNILRHITELDHCGVNGFVLFNRLFQPDIDIQKEQHYFPFNLSSENDNRMALRYAGLLSGKTKGSICCNTGILNGTDVIKMLLAGADTVQVVSAVYRKGVDHISRILTDIESWMDEKKYKSIDQFRAKLSNEKLKDSFAYKRAQYVDILMKPDNYTRHKGETNP